jgi:hypothetical protein
VWQVKAALGDTFDMRDVSGVMADAFAVVDDALGYRRRLQEQEHERKMAEARRSKA